MAITTQEYRPKLTATHLVSALWRFAMSRRLVALALILIASSAAGAAQLHKVNVDDTTTRHTYDPAKLTVVERTVPDRNSPTGDVKVWRLLTDYGLILGTLSTKVEADVALDAAQKFTKMIIVGRSPRTFTYFER